MLLELKPLTWIQPKNEGPLGVDTSHSSLEPQEQDCDVDVSNSREESSRVIQRRSFLDEKLSNYKQEKLKQKLPVDAQLAQSAKDDIEVKRRLLETMEQMDKQYTENMSKLSTNMDRLTDSIADGFSLLRSLLVTQPTMFQPQPCGGHMYPPQQPMFNGQQPQQPMFNGQQPQQSMFNRQQPQMQRPPQQSGHQHPMYQFNGQQQSLTPDEENSSTLGSLDDQ